MLQREQCVFLRKDKTLRVEDDLVCNRTIDLFHLGFLRKTGIMSPYYAMKNKHRTHKGTSKRFKVTGTGKVLHRSHTIRHLRTAKSKNQIRRLKQMKEVEGQHAKKIKQLLGIA